MTQHNDLWYTIGGRILPVRELLSKETAPTTPLHAIESIGGEELFCNPWGNGSAVALGLALECAADRASKRPEPCMSLNQAVDVIAGMQSRLEFEMARGVDSELLHTLIDLKGLPITEIRDSIVALGRVVLDLQKDQRMLRAMLDTDEPQLFFAEHDVTPRFGLVASANLGLYETAILVWSAILALAARNGMQFSLIIKPSIYDCLFHELIRLLPDDVRAAFSRITWRSEGDIIPDSTLIAQLVKAVNGAIYFGNRTTLVRFRDLVEGDRRYHHFYYDHFPIMILLPGVEASGIAAAAKLATLLAYRNRGESCLSLQDIFVHQELYDEFLVALMREWRMVCAASGDPARADTSLPSYSRVHLEQIAQLRDRLDGAVVGRVYPEKNRTDLLVNYEIPVDNWVLATENAAPLLCVGAFLRPAGLLRSLRDLRHKSSSDKFIYALVIAGEKEDALARVCEGLEALSHRVEPLISNRDISGFQAYGLGIPHCGGLSFLADMFGLPHRRTCYSRRQL